MERRAVMVSHELWQQMMTQGYETGGLRCTRGLPEGARLIGAFYRFNLSPAQWPDPVFVFESDRWPDPPGSYMVEHDGNTYSVEDVVFESMYDGKPVAV